MILRRLELNGRMGDYYDIYLIYVSAWKNINVNHFRKAIEKTFSRREYTGDMILALNIIKESDILNARWKSYQGKYDYARNIEFDEIVTCIGQIIEQIETAVS